MGKRLASLLSEKNQWGSGVENKAEDSDTLGRMICKAEITYERQAIHLQLECF